MRLRLLTLVLAVLTFTTAAAIDPGRAFVSAPESLFPLIPKMKRMDMLDYFRAGVTKPQQNRLGGDSRILSETDGSIVIEEAGGSNVVTSISAARGSAKQDTVLIVVSNYLTPAADGAVKIYTTAWNPVNGIPFTEPMLHDWIVPKPKMPIADIENIVPFVTARYEYDPESGILTLTNTLGNFLAKEEYEQIKESVIPQIRYKWNGKKMTRQK